MKAFVRKYWSWGLLLIVAWYAFRSVAPDIDLSERADDAPAFTGLDMDGRPFDLSELHGNVVVVNFWATWCGPCRAEIPGFIDLQDEFRGRGVVFVGAAMDEGGFDVVRPYVEKHGINYTQVLGDGSLARRFGGTGVLPTTFLIDAEGRIRYQHEGLLLKVALRPALKELLEEADLLAERS